RPLRARDIRREPERSNTIACSNEGETSLRSFRFSAASALFILTMLAPSSSWAWGDEGHKIVALIAARYLRENDPSALPRIEALLQRDADAMTPPDIASRATWADRYRETHSATGNWHFIDINTADPVSHPDLDTPCKRPHPQTNVPASQGPADNCVVDKITAF